MDGLEANEDPDNNLEMKKLRPLLKSHLGFFQGKSHRAFCNAVMTTVTKLVTKGSIKFNKKKQMVTRCVTPVTDDVTVLGKGGITKDIRESGVYAGMPLRPVKLWRKAIAKLYAGLR